MRPTSGSNPLVAALRAAALALLGCFVGCAGQLANPPSTGGCAVTVPPGNPCPDDQVEVPDLRGRDARTSPTWPVSGQVDFVIEELTVAQMRARFGDDQAAWPAPKTVLDQSPPGGPLAIGETITLRIAPDPPPDNVNNIVVPSLAGLTEADARAAANDAGLALVISRMNVADMLRVYGANAANWPPTGTVAQQSLAAGSTASDGDTLSVVVAPDGAQVAGSLVGQDAAEVAAWLQKSGIQVRRKKENASRPRELGRVLSARVVSGAGGQPVVELVEGRRRPATAVTKRDTDKDGVVDTLDDCPDTPASTPVDANGCARVLDTDADGVADAQDQCPATPMGTKVDENGCQAVATVVTGDGDADGVPDSRDKCPGTSRDELEVDANGCSLTQKVAKLKTGLYAFNRPTAMEVGRAQPYDLVLVLDPRDTRTPEGVTNAVLEELPASAIESTPLDDPAPGDRCEGPVRCVEGKYHDRMRVTLSVDQPGWAIEPGDGGENRIVVRNEQTVWRWKITPACNGGGLLSDTCEPAELSLQAFAVLDEANFGPFRILDENIAVRVSLAVRLASFAGSYGALILGAIALILAALFVPRWLKRRGAATVVVSAPEYEPTRVLFIGANPQSTGRIRLDEEVRAIDQAIRLGERRDAFELSQHWAARVSDLDDALMRYKPHIVHISAHGTSRGELMLEGGEDADGKLSAAQLERLFAILADDIRLVVLNACYSSEQGERVVNHVDCVVGMSDEVNDNVATAFSSAFYLALANGRSVRTAFDLACAESAVGGADEVHVPRLLALRADPDRVTFARRAPARDLKEVTA